MLDRYWWHYRNWSLPWIWHRSLQWWPHHYASRLRCGERYDIFHGCSPWRNDNTFSCRRFICGLLVKYIESELKIPFQSHYATRWLDPAIGFALGYNYWYTYAIMVPTEITAASIVISYWDATTNPGVWITICLAVVVFFNLYATLYACCRCSHFSTHIICLAAQCDTTARLNSGSPLLK